MILVQTSNALLQIVYFFIFDNDLLSQVIHLSEICLQLMIFCV